MNSTKNNKFILYSIILGFLGFLVATYLTILHYKHIIPSCSISGGCERVLTSQFANIGPIPISLLGSLFYLTVIVLCILILTNYKKLFIDLFYAASAVGFLFSVVLILIQALILHAFCQYCLTSETVSTGILILAYFDYRGRKTS
jgi:uncharacterized membrane protein